VLKAVAKPDDLNKNVLHDIKRCLFRFEKEEATPVDHGGELPVIGLYIDGSGRFFHHLS
jgi:hypothetical protein